jgi:hypothetical protein
MENLEPLPVFGIRWTSAAWAKRHGFEPYYERPIYGEYYSGWYLEVSQVVEEAIQRFGRKNIVLAQISKWGWAYTRLYVRRTT